MSGWKKVYFCSMSFDLSLENYNEIFSRARRASRSLLTLDDQRISGVLLAVADEAEKQAEYLLAQNRLDLERMPADHPWYDRLLLTSERIDGIAADLRNVAELPSPVGIELDRNTRPNGMTITKLTVPFGVIGIIYEARPNVGFDCFALGFKSGNAVLLKGGSDAKHSNQAIVSLIRKVLAEQGIEADAVQLLPTGHDAATAMLEAVGQVDLVIPRGSQGLIRHVRENAKVPVIETGAGICHTYFDKAGDTATGAAIVFNAKTRRVSVCNALDCLVIHRERLGDLPIICAHLASKNVTIEADQEAYASLSDSYPAGLLAKATEKSFGTEFLDYRLAIKTVGSVEEAIEHINKYSSQHSEAIVSEDEAALCLFENQVDAACVYLNVSTAFTDGAQFGLGAEIGISTQKLHARGPMALRELTTYKYVIKGNGQIRNT